MIAGVHLRARRALVRVQPWHVPLPAVEVAVAVLARAGPLAVGDLGADRGREGDARVGEECRRHRVDPQRRFPRLRHHHRHVLRPRPRLGQEVGHLRRVRGGLVAAVGQHHVLALDAPLERRRAPGGAGWRLLLACGDRGGDGGGVGWAEEQGCEQAENRENEPLPVVAPAAVGSKKWIRIYRQTGECSGEPVYQACLWFVVLHETRAAVLRLRQGAESRRFIDSHDAMTMASN
ncbi:hypothetical protein VTK26DRAFT_1625 [Humicola hyalothermophila]